METPKFNEDTEALSIPTVLAYADDLLIVTEEEQDIINFLENMTPHLDKAGLKINFKKSQIMVRDPSTKECPVSGEEYKIGNFTLRTTNKMKYLGTYLTSQLKRRETVKERIKTAYRVTRAILPFIEKNKPTWTLVQRIYTAIILPTMTYVVKNAATAKANRRSLRRAERDIVQLLAKTIGLKERQKTSTLVGGKTVTKRIETYAMKYWGHVQRRDPTHLLKKAVKSELQ